jgi:MerR family redox-sensitive transcriptional activator SoxR
VISYSTVGCIGTVLPGRSGGTSVGVKVDLMSNPDPEPGRAPLLAIGELAGLAGKRPSAIRYYEQAGLLPPPARIAGRRRYHHQTVHTLAVIDTAQRAGLALDEIKTLLSASPDDGEAVDRLRDLAERKLPEITALIERSQLVREWLESAARCECPGLDQCPLFDDHPPPEPAPRQPPQPSPRTNTRPNRGP